MDHSAESLDFFSQQSWVELPQQVSAATSAPGVTRNHREMTAELTGLVTGVIGGGGIEDHVQYKDQQKNNNNKKNLSTVVGFLTWYQEQLHPTLIFYDICVKK